MDIHQTNSSQKAFYENNPEWGEKYSWQWNKFNCHWRLLGKENNKPLLLLHGFGASSSHWRYNADYFAKNGFKVYALDLIGFGKSDQPDKKHLNKLDNYLWSMQVASFIKEVVITIEIRKDTINRLLMYQTKVKNKTIINQSQKVSILT